VTRMVERVCAHLWLCGATLNKVKHPVPRCKPRSGNLAVQLSGLSGCKERDWGGEHGMGMEMARMGSTDGQTTGTDNPPRNEWCQFFLFNTVVIVAGDASHDLLTPTWYGSTDAQTNNSLDFLFHFVPSPECRDPQTGPNLEPSAPGCSPSRTLAFSHSRLLGWTRRGQRVRAVSDDLRTDKCPGTPSPIPHPSSPIGCLASVLDSSFSLIGVITSVPTQVR
jgi:hypothetical protein